MCSMGCLVQALNPASASDAPMTLRKLRREKSSVHSEAWRGNSRCSISWKPSVFDSSSRLRQYVGPVALVSASRTFASSSGFASAGFFARSVLQSLLQLQFPVSGFHFPATQIFSDLPQRWVLSTEYFIYGTLNSW